METIAASVLCVGLILGLVEISSIQLKAFQKEMRLKVNQ